MLSKLSPQDIAKRTYGICDIHHISYPHSYPHSYPQGPGKMWAKSHATRRVESCILGQGMLLFSYKKLTKVVKEKDKK